VRFNAASSTRRLVAVVDAGPNKRHTTPHRDAVQNGRTTRPLCVVRAQYRARLRKPMQ
jgi:hypothetical protein